MSSSQELYNRLDEKLRALVEVKNRKQVTNWIWVIVGILQSESCNLSQIANCLPMETKAESRVMLVRRWLSNSQVNVWPFYKKMLEHVLSGWSSVEVDLILDGVMVFGDRWQIFRVSLRHGCSLMISASMIFLMARLRYENSASFALAAAFFTLPTVMLNSTGWGQVDSLYTSFLLICVYLLLKQKPFWALLVYGIAFSFKAQAIFLLPFLGLMFLKGKLRWYHFLLIPVPYLVLTIPAVLIGRSWESILFLYTGQVDQFRNLAKTVPNLYIFFSDQYYQPAVTIGITIFLIIMFIWAWNYWRAKITLTHDFIMLTALTSLALVPFLLPKMHDRYFYPADVFSIATALFIREMWFVPILYQFISGFAYIVFLFAMPAEFVKTAAIINTFAVAYLFRKQLMFLHKADKLQDPL